MNITTKDYLKILVLTAVFYAGVNLVIAQTVDAPNNPANPATPLRVNSSVQKKQGPLKVNTTTSNPISVGLNVNQGFQLYSTISNLSRLYLDELGDAASTNLSGIEL